MKYQDKLRLIKKIFQEIEDKGFFIGLLIQILDKKKINKITN